MNIILFILILPLICSCSTNVTREDLAIDQIVSAYSIKMKNKNNFYLLGSGLSYPTNLKAFLLRFQTIQSLNIQEARRLIMSCSFDLVELINSNKNIRPILSNFPCTYKNVDLIISLVDSNGESVKPPFISVIFFTNGEIYYDIKKPFACNLENVHKETFEEALKILQEE